MTDYEAIGQAILSEYGITVRKWRTDMSGVAWHHCRDIECPRPRSPLSLAVLAHEVGHHELGHTDGNRQPRWREEYDAWQFAIATLRARAITPDKRTKEHMAHSLAYALAKALNRGMTKVPPELRPYKKLLTRRPVYTIYGDGHNTTAMRYRVK